MVSPVLKWVGGKRKLLKDLEPLFPKNITSYCEPFLGGGAVLFHLKPEQALVNDKNQELIQMYEVIRDYPEELIECLKKFQNTEQCFYEIRAWDRNHFENKSKIEQAARTIYLNKTCFNGLYRVNQSGYFNAPYGKNPKADFVMEDKIREISGYFQKSDIKFMDADYKEVFDQIPDNSFVYLDPPYDPVSKTANFTSYTKEGFTYDEQIKLRDCCAELDKKGIKFMLSNAATDQMLDLYQDFDIQTIQAGRSINSDAKKRGKVNEIVVRNYN